MVSGERQKFQLMQVDGVLEAMGFSSSIENPNSNGPSTFC